MPSPGRVKWAKFRVTAVTLVALAILVTMLYELFGGILQAPKTVVYMYLPDATGLSGESPVRVDGPAGGASRPRRWSVERVSVAQRAEVGPGDPVADPAQGEDDEHGDRHDRDADP